MNHSARFCCIFTACLLLAGALAKGAPVDRFVRTQERIDALVKRRLNPPSLPADLPNPFLLGGGTKRPDGTDADSPDGSTVTAPPRKTGEPTAGELPPVGSDTEILARFVAKLRLTGRVLLNGRTHLIINQAPYKEGDFVPVNSSKDAPIYVQVVRITPDELTLGLNQAVQTITLKGL